MIIRSKVMVCNSETYLYFHFKNITKYSNQDKNTNYLTKHLAESTHITYIKLLPFQ